MKINLKFMLLNLVLIFSTTISKDDVKLFVNAAAIYSPPSPSRTIIVYNPPSTYYTYYSGYNYGKSTVVVGRSGGALGGIIFCCICCCILFFILVIAFGKPLQRVDNDDHYRS